MEELQIAVAVEQVDSWALTGLASSVVTAAMRRQAAV